MPETGEAPTGAANTTDTTDAPQSGSDTSTAGGDTSKPAEKRPPWGDAENFDAEKAWDLVQNLRREKGFDKQQRLDELEKAAKEAADAALTETQRLEKERDEARGEKDSAAAEVARLRAAVKYGLAEDEMELLEGIPAEKVAAIAEKLSKRLGGKSPEKRPRSHVENLRGGGDPTEEPAETDVKKIGERMFAR